MHVRTNFISPLLLAKSNCRSLIVFTVRYFKSFIFILSYFLVLTNLFKPLAMHTPGFDLYMCVF